MNDLIAAAGLLYREASARTARLRVEAAKARDVYERLENEANAAMDAERNAQRALLAIAKQGEAT